MKYIKKLIRNSKRALNQQVIKKKQEIVKYAPRLTGIQDSSVRFLTIYYRHRLLRLNTSFEVSSLQNWGRHKR